MACVSLHAFSCLSEGAAAAAACGVGLGLGDGVHKLYPLFVVSLVATSGF